MVGNHADHDKGDYDMFFKDKAPEAEVLLPETEDEDFVDVQGWLAVDSDGNFMFHNDSASDANEELRSNNTSDAVKVYELNLRVRRPKVIVVEATLPDTDEPVTITIS